MKSHTKRKKLILLIVVPIILQALLYGGVFYYFALLAERPLDFSQDYRAVQGIENVVFWRDWNEQCYRRCFWGLQKTDDTIPTDKPYVSDASWDRLRDLVEIEHTLHQSIYSPNQDYILYCEIDYDFNHSGTTDDEYCYYKVYEMETGKIIPVFQGYRQWYSLLWTE